MRSGNRAVGAVVAKEAEEAEEAVRVLMHIWGLDE